MKLEEAANSNLFESFKRSSCLKAGQEEEEIGDEATIWLC